jgi:hypothetical protein
MKEASARNQKGKNNVDVTINADTQTYGVGPFTVDVAMARRLNYPEDDIKDACRIVAIVAQAFAYKREDEAKKKTTDTRSPRQKLIDRM